MSGFSAKAEYTINAYHVAIDFASTYVENLIKYNADKEKIFKWLTAFNNNLSKNVSNCFYGGCSIKCYKRFI